MATGEVEASVAAEDSEDTKSPGHHIWALVSIVKDGECNISSEFGLV